MDNTTNLAVNQTLFLLKHIALDPLQGKTMAQLTSMTGPIYIKKGPLEPDTIFFALRFFGIDNPVGFFALDVHSNQVPLLFKAIEDNLKSPQFKAAVLSNKLRDTSIKRQAHLREKAQKAYNEVIAQAKTQAPSWKIDRSRFFDSQVYPQAKAAYDQIYQPGWDAMQKRIFKVTSKTVSSQLQQNPTALAEAFKENFFTD